MSRDAGKPQISLHYKKQCIILDNIECHVPTYGKINTSQPYFVMRGRANKITIHNNVGKVE